MSSTHALLRCAVCGIALLACALGWAGEMPVANQSPLAFDGLVDQFGKPFDGTEQMALIMLVSGMKAKNLVRDTLERVDVGCLRDRRVVYLADISGMPKLISKLFAVPKMRDLSYPVWLDYSGEVADSLPSETDRITVLSLDSPRHVSAVNFVATGEQLGDILTAECGASPGPKINLD